MSERATRWISFKPDFSEDRSSDLWLPWAEDLATDLPADARERRSVVRQARDEARALAPDFPPADRTRAIAAADVACDLARQGWAVRFSGDGLRVRPPERSAVQMDEKRRVRDQLHVQRDAQLSGSATQRFLARMEAKRWRRGKWVSIYSLMRDGRVLADDIRQANALQDPESRLEALGRAVRPYLQQVRGRERCPQTGFALRDIWRYFRHTWASPYRTTPGRNIDLLVRDASVEPHPVIGIASIISSAAQIAIRDEWIGWSPGAVLSALEHDPDPGWARWMEATWARSRSELYVQDLYEDGVLTPASMRRPTADTIARLRQYSAEKRLEHQRFARSSQHTGAPGGGDDGDPDWERRARTPLYKSKRAARLADLLRARRILDAHLSPPRAGGMRALRRSSEGKWLIRFLARRAKADKMGVAIADIGVCGAVAPYNHLLGGKLVAMLMVSPQVRSFYEERYGGAHSVIASSNAGAPVVRGTDLALLMTTSLYGSGSSQYNRIRIPCERVGGTAGQKIRFERLGLTQGFGTSQFGEDTVASLSRLISQEADGRRNNSYFGEGTNPRLRKVREGLDRLGLRSEALLRHGSPKGVYAIPLAANLQRFLLGLDERPDYLLDQSRPEERTDQIARWWTERWLSMRAAKDEILERVEKETLSHPVRHGARVQRPREVAHGPLFFE